MGFNIKMENSFLLFNQWNADCDLSYKISRPK